MPAKIYKALFTTKNQTFIDANSLEEAGKKAREIVKQKGGMKVCTLLSVEQSSSESSPTVSQH